MRGGRIITTVAAAAAATIQCTSAFHSTPFNNINIHTFHNLNTANTRPVINNRVSSTRSMLYSSVGEQEQDTNTNNSNKGFKFKLPQPPEDILVLSGDISGLLIYSYLDHLLNHIYVQSETVAALQAQQALGVNALWRDLGTGYTPPSLVPPDVVSLNLPCYSAMLHEPGVSLAVMTAAWLVSGFFTEAFRFENTVYCDTRRALTVTTGTWFLACTLMLGMTVAGDVALCGCSQKLLLLQETFTNVLTRTDTDFIVDSFSVIVSWRFIVSWMLSRFY